MSDRHVVTILGGGNGAFATAADLKLKGFTVRLLETPALSSHTLTPINERGGIELIDATTPDVISRFVEIDLITDNPELALVGADIVLYVVPAFAERHFTDLCGSFLQPEQLVVFFCGNFGGALEFVQQMRSRGFLLPRVAETEGLPYAALKQGPATVKISGTKSGLSCAAYPATRTIEALASLKHIVPDCQPAANVLETGLRNINPILHAPISVLNAGRTEPDKPKWHYYTEGVPEAVGNVCAGVDEERLRVGRALGLDLPAAIHVLDRWYSSQGAHGSIFGEFLRTNPAYQMVWAPQTLEHRFLTEDIPFGLVPIERLGKKANVPTPVITALITLASTLLARDLRRAGRDLEGLGLTGSAEELKRCAEGHRVQET